MAYLPEILTYRRHERPPVDATERQLLDAVLAAPDDDAPRLVYADWALAHADPAIRARGELIVVECQLEQLADVAEHNRLKARDFQLLEEHGLTWCGHLGLGGFVTDQPWRRATAEWDAEFRRGFIDELVLEWQWIQRLVHVLRFEPVRTVILRSLQGGAAPRQLEHAPILARVRRLGFHGMRPSAATVTSTYVRALDGFELRGIELADRLVDAVAAALGSWRQLALRTTNLTAAHVATVVGAPGAEALRELALDGNPLGDVAARVLIEAPRLAALARLTIDAAPISPPLRTALAARFAVTFT